LEEGIHQTAAVSKHLIKLNFKSYIGIFSSKMHNAVNRKWPVLTRLPK
jgi:hypothetical protein